MAADNEKYQNKDKNVRKDDAKKAGSSKARKIGFIVAVVVIIIAFFAAGAWAFYDTSEEADALPMPVASVAMED